MQIWAHRGASAHAPENTLEAFELAIAQGADGIELDVRQSADGVPVVIHDATTDRVSGQGGFVGQLRLSELRRYDVSQSMPGHDTAQIPLLAEVYELVRPTGLAVNVEIKNGLFDGSGIEKELIALERGMGMRGRVLYSSFNPFDLLAVRALDPHAQIGLLYIGGWVDVWQYVLRLDANALHPPVYLLEEVGFVERCREAGVALHVWGIDSGAELRLAQERGVTAAIVDDPAWARTVLAGGLHPVI